ncbi:MAG TPA: 3-oxoadipate enol-lactonase [Rugosimonospora sp.]|nr:3-oxoadipate enol-lactonase [Rugosimonospora sp.]
MTILHAEVSGPPGAPVLVLGGSLGTTLDMWQPLLDELGGGYRVLRYDHRGHGGSPVPPGPYTVDELGRDVLALLDARGLDRVLYCGLSLGGMVGMWLAAHAPERIERLALLCTAAYLPAGQGYRDRAAQVRAAGVGSVAEAVLARWFTVRYLARHDVAGYRAMLAGTPAEGYAGCCEAIAAMDLRPVLPRIVAPTLVVSGSDDPAIPPPFGEQIAAAVPGARFEALDDAAHLAAVEQPGAVARLLRQHLTVE